MKFTRNENGQACSVIEPELVNHVRALEIVKSLIGLDGRIYPIPYSHIQNDTLDTLNLVMQALGLYTFPTLELCEWLESQIDDNPEYEPHSAIEICGGTGWIGRQLRIPTTDVKNMENPEVQRIMLDSMSVPTVYANDVETLEASEAVNKYKPDIVIGSYVTSKQLVDKIDKKKAMTIGIKLPYGGVLEQNLMDLAREEVKVGVDINSICRKVYKVILVCNMRTHRNEAYISLPHQTLSFPWLVTRGDISQARILIFENKHWLIGEFMQITFLRTKDDPLFNFNEGLASLIINEPCEYEIKELKNKKYLKIKLSKKNARDQLLANLYEAMFTSEYLYIPMKYIMSIKEGVSTEDF